MEDQLTVSLHIADSNHSIADETSRSLFEWLRQSDLQASVSLQHAQTSGTQGGYVEALTVILGSAAVVELVKSLQVWIKATRPKGKFVWKSEHDSIEIDVENPHDLDFLFQKFSQRH